MGGNICDSFIVAFQSVLLYAIFLSLSLTHSHYHSVDNVLNAFSKDDELKVLETHATGGTAKIRLLHVGIRMQEEEEEALRCPLRSSCFQIIHLLFKGPQKWAMIDYFDSRIIFAPKPF